MSRNGTRQTYIEPIETLLQWNTNRKSFCCTAKPYLYGLAVRYKIHDQTVSSERLLKMVKIWQNFVKSTLLRFCLLRRTPIYGTSFVDFVVALPEDMATYESLQMRNRELPPLPSVYDRLHRTTRRWSSFCLDFRWRCNEAMDCTTTYVRILCGDIWQP